MRASQPYEQVLDSQRDAGRALVRGAELNYAENMLLALPATATPSARSRSCTPRSCASWTQLTWGELTAQVAHAAGGLRALGVRRGDRVVAYMPNIPETLVAFLAVASIGAIWSSAAPEFGARSVIDRFAQIEPKVLLAVDGYRHGGKDFDRTAVAAARSSRSCRRVEHVVLLPYLSPERDAPIGLPRGHAAGASCWSWARRSDATRARARSRCASSRCPSTTRCGCSTPRARPACRRRSCTATAGSCSSS